MKRMLVWLGLVLLPIFSLAQNDAAALVAQREAEENYRILAATVQKLEDNQKLFQQRQEDLLRRLERLEKRLEEVREEGVRAQINFVSRDDLKQVVDSVKQMEKQRGEDQKEILRTIEGLAKLPAARPAETRTAPSRSESRPEEKKKPKDHLTADVLLHEVKASDKYLSNILKAYNDHFASEGRKSISLADIVDANEGMKANDIRVGQEIKIPVPVKK